MNTRLVVTSAALFLGGLFVAGCGSSATGIRPTPHQATAPIGSANRYAPGTLSPGNTEIPAHIAAAVMGHLTSELRKRGLLGDDASAAIRIDATTTYYRMRSGFSRMMVGVLAGKDGIRCDVQLVDPASGRTLGEFQVSSFNITALGNEDDIARMLAAEIAKSLEKHRG